jgi:hypothetical protein
MASRNAARERQPCSARTSHILRGRLGQSSVTHQRYHGSGIAQLFARYVGASRFHPASIPRALRSQAFAGVEPHRCRLLLTCTNSGVHALGELPSWLCEFDPRHPLLDVWPGEAQKFQISTRFWTARTIRCGRLPRRTLPDAGAPLRVRGWCPVRCEKRQMATCSSPNGRSTTIGATR